MRLDLESLPTDIPLLHKIIRDMLHAFSEEIESLKEQLGKLKAQLHLSNAKTYGQSSEKLEKLGDLEEFIKEDAESNERAVSQPKRQKLPEHLPRRSNT